ncbi:MAG TPA: M56 family metallopeptidase [Chitinophagaceae bacterium]|nr:M56 family metallopeptidase [Chitinophagaceae bacterium]
MPFLFDYLLKLNIALLVVYLFYRLVLSRLTFYLWNRLYLVFYTAICFVIPFININPFLNKASLNESTWVKAVPVLQKFTAQLPLTHFNAQHTQQVNLWEWVTIILIIGAMVLLFRLIMQLYSYKRMKYRATLLGVDGIKLFQVEEDILPFSFGNSIYINRHRHSAAELEEIIRHEFIHIKQKHSLDVLFGELLCIVNWYNPFAWFIRQAIRQNLEFIADDNVLQSGLNKKEYQYLLLKVTGAMPYSIAHPFNLSSLKKRITMMNKMKSAKLHLAKFLFVLPLAAVLLLAFRHKIQGNEKNSLFPPSQVVSTMMSEISNKPDSIPDTTLNEKGFYIEVKENKGNCLVVVRDKNKKEVTQMLLTKWEENQSDYENRYGIIDIPSGCYENSAIISKEFSSMVINDNRATIKLKNGTIEKYNLDNPDEKETFENKYGVMPPIPPTPPVVTLPATVQTININNNKATVTLKNGDIERYDLNNKEQKASYEAKYGAVVSPVAIAPGAVISKSSVISNSAPPAVKPEVADVIVVPNNTPDAPISPVVVSTDAPTPAEIAIAPLIDDEVAPAVNDYVIVIIKNTDTRQSIEQTKETAKRAGYQLVFDNIEFNKKGEVIKLSGYVKGKKGKLGSFDAVDFTRVRLFFRSDDQSNYFTVDVKG